MKWPGNYSAKNIRVFFSFCSIAKSCPTLWDPMDWSPPGFPVPSASPSVCPSSCPLDQYCHPTISSSVTLYSICLQSFPGSGSFPISQLFISGDQSNGALASASVLLKSIQGWFPLRLTGLISLLTKGLSRVLSSTAVKKLQFFKALPSLLSKSHISMSLWERP